MCLPHLLHVLCMLYLIAILSTLLPDVPEHRYRHISNLTTLRAVAAITIDALLIFQLDLLATSSSRTLTALVAFSHMSAQAAAVPYSAVPEKRNSAFTVPA
jgi:hypothetical protein